MTYGTHRERVRDTGLKSEERHARRTAICRLGRSKWLIHKPSAPPRPCNLVVTVLVVPARRAASEGTAGSRCTAMDWYLQALHHRREILQVQRLRAIRQRERRLRM